MISKKNIRDNNLTEDDVIEIIMEATGSDRATAEFIYAIETGEIESDVIELDKSGNPVNAKKEALEAT
jgi:hypothetical protein